MVVPKISVTAIKQKDMKKLLVVLTLTAIGNVSFSQSVSAKFYPEYGDNPLAQELPHPTLPRDSISWPTTPLFPS